MACVLQFASFHVFGLAEIPGTILGRAGLDGESLIAGGGLHLPLVVLSYNTHHVHVVGFATYVPVFASLLKLRN